MFFVVLLLALCPSADAHFKLNLNIRVIHVDHRAEGVDVYLRLPMPYLVANLVGDEEADGTRAPAPYTFNRIVDDELMHYVDASALQRSASGLGQLAADGHTLRVGARALPPVVKQTLVYVGDEQPPFSTLEEAKRAFAKPDQAPLKPAPFVGDTVVDVLIAYRTGEPVGTYELSSSLNPGLEGQEQTANLIIDYEGSTSRIFRITGLMHEPVSVSKSSLAAAKTFVTEGIAHILGGYDHVLYVICLVIGAITLTSLAWRITGFTLGHSVTLSLGFFGYSPQAPWFIPLVETGIALSIIYAAILALRSDKSDGERAYVGTFVSTAMVGMLHGLGFSFVLKEILGLQSANIWTSLVFFNVGVELGQLAIVLLVWPLLWGITKLGPALVQPLKWTVALPCIAIASVWVGERSVSLMSFLG